MANAELIAAIRSELRAAADPVRAGGAQAYLKSEMSSLGVRVPAVRRHRLRGLLQAHRPEMAAVLRRWSTDGDFWIRRASITAQLGAKSATDTALLGDVIEANLADREFFIRKAIGWALRDFSATDPDWVRGFVERHRAGLSPLSIAEALRKLPR
ncbi:3-methyladenine DNA glycosylase AlkD [Arthrobacter sp. V4I6]|uniref:DNA alkylation repair protein n=1 Tax=unclassified Arthrobacter TaxID=235627 RepID=UPI00277E66A1|nr:MULTISPECIES: DNA alkylation repair protein [unclassified Arthrobacter]MDQ0820611.1 3-methyladenine DNA glycosylase AlkD [Arthrobacter sp. V1I7]MDQ0854869.1 3-methyladenine DNA glycosylase AlkD [Arthrobacter sp. V4I6]